MQARLDTLVQSSGGLDFGPPKRGRTITNHDDLCASLSDHIVFGSKGALSEECNLLDWIP